MEFHEHLLAEAMGRFAKALENAGCARADDAQPSARRGRDGAQPGRIAQVVDLVGLDYYHPANPKHHMTILRRTGELAVAAKGARVPAYGAEVGAGSRRSSRRSTRRTRSTRSSRRSRTGSEGSTLHGGRSRSLGRRADRRARPAAAVADDYRALIEALDRGRVQHAQAARSGAAGRAARAPAPLARDPCVRPRDSGGLQHRWSGPLESCLEDDFGLAAESAGNDEQRLARRERCRGRSLRSCRAPIAGESFVRAFERALVARGVPFAYAGGEELEASIKDAAWIVCTTAGGLKRDVLDMLRGAQHGRRRGHDWADGAEA